MFKFNYRFIFVSLFAFIISTTSWAQYAVTGPTPGQGPLLNTESTSSSTGWTNIHAYNAGGGSSINSWSAANSIGFPFSFAGSPVTQFCVSKNFLLTFTTSVASTTLPAGISTNNTALPNATLPDKTIAYMWAGFGNPAPIGSNDNVWSKTFGTAPNRQLWIKNFSYETEGQSFVYNYVVLEETTNNIYVVDARNATVSASTRTVGVQSSPSSAVQDPNSPNIAAIHSNSTTPWPNVDYWTFTYIPRILNDAGVTDIISPVNECGGYLQDVEVEIRNLGINQINNVEIHWTINGVAQTTFNYTQLLDTVGGVGPDSAIVVIGSTALTASVTDTIVAWTEMPNSVPDGENANDTSDATARGRDLPTVTMGAIPSNKICYGTLFLFKATAVTSGSTMYQWKINTVNYGAPTTNNLLTNPDLMSGDSVNVDLVTDDCDTTGTYAVPSNYITMNFSPDPILISGSAETDTVIENTSSNYLVPVDSLSTFTWSAIGGTISNPVGNSVTVDWGSQMDTAKIMVTEKDAGNCSYTNERNVFIISIVGVKDENSLIGIGYAYPNPANTSVTIPLVIDGSWNIDLSLYDMTGKKVKAIYNGEVSGNRNFTFDVEDLDNGIYFYKISTQDGYESVKKLSIKH